MDSRAPLVITVLTTAPDQETAERLGRTLVEERLVACVSVVPGMTSIYRWEGTLRHEAEILMILKTTPEALRNVVTRLGELHPYAVPEVLALPVSRGAESYLEWVRSEVGA